MVELKRLHRGSLEPALDRAERYRLLNEPTEAESICRDVLEVDAGNQRAIRALILSLTDQFGRELGDRVRQAHELLERLEDEYERAYHQGIVHERHAKAQLKGHAVCSGPAIHDRLQLAMQCYEQAERLRPEGNDEALLRWNA